MDGIMSDTIPCIRKVEEELNNELLEDYSGEKTGWCYVGETNYLLPSKYEEQESNLMNFEAREDDVWIVTFPRSGTTLTQDLVWLLMNNFDYEKGSKINLWTRSPFFEFYIFIHDETAKLLLEENDTNPAAQEIINEISMPALARLKNMESPRLIKTHLPISLLPKEAKSNKIIYVARNPKDILHSYYFLVRLWRFCGYTNNFLQFWKQFKNGHVPWGPFWPHIIEAWNYRHNENVLFLFYEEIVEDLPKAIFKIANFLEIDATEEQVEGLADHMSIKNFSKNKSVNMEGLKSVGILNNSEPPFIRKGKKRERPEEYTPEVENEVEKWILENYATTDLRFPISE